MISCQQNQSIFCRYFNMRHYQNPAVNMRNRLATWVLFRLSFAFVNFLVMFIVARTFPKLFNICPLQRLQPDLYYMFTDVRLCLFTKSHRKARKRHIRNSNKNL